MFVLIGSHIIIRIAAIDEDSSAVQILPVEFLRMSRIAL